MKKLLINLTNHPSQEWNEEQLKAAYSYGEIEDMEFPTIPPYMGEEKEYLVQYTKQYMKDHSDVDYFIYGHRHIELDLMLSRKCRMMIIGDWIWQFTYVLWDGEHMFIEEYVEGESKL